MTENQNELKPCDREAQFERWLRTVCFQAPTKEAYDLAKAAWNTRATSPVERQIEAIRAAYNRWSMLDLKTNDFIEAVEKILEEGNG